MITNEAVVEVGSYGIHSLAECLDMGNSPLSQTIYFRKRGK